MSRSTPPRPVDVTALFPQLASLARTATRLHPRPGAPTPHDSSVGGPLLWPADEPWPHCAGPHVRDQVNAALSPQDVRAQRRDRADAAGRPGGRTETAGDTAEERAIHQRADVGHPWPGGPIAMLPVAQLYVRDVPSLRPPGGSHADVLQVLWCPFDHPAHPRTTLFWRSAATVADLIGAPPEPPAVQFPGYLPEPCLLEPEQVTEYPHFMELSEELRQRLKDWGRWQTAGAAVDSFYAPAPEELYMNKLSVAPGWKVGGWTRWGLTDPEPRLCPACGVEARPLLTIATSEWDAGTKDWAPEEDRSHSVASLPGHPPANFTSLDLARGYDLQLHICPASQDHPHIELVQ
ncbi:hypothetical protein IPZ64_00405 [Streptomyces violaceoruber]|uniref:hypothetical protein n=1 Tax=Streptomyces violaceoruber TaxID=1935 RepID=UPI001F2AF639|nr:hypothetical protein [Streptomyces violaceoruber]MCF3165408.1 hypothetical protein [Streptomyces violaceoruber]